MSVKAGYEVLFMRDNFVRHNLGGDSGGPLYSRSGECLGIISIYPLTAGKEYQMSTLAFSTTSSGSKPPLNIVFSS
ncbi:Protein of unknown function [Cotesia congregata]|uniref:Uncharacterized protein n=1 Tax=Cotesia congregata TaxID=51543 RepID=A0A8J2HDN5_COTCN|nr:Protein of unknown function [Cotesia congregata]